MQDNGTCKMTNFSSIPTFGPMLRSRVVSSVIDPFPEVCMLPEIYMSVSRA
jgi:hypothetical protein